jgi:hypothetical protein
VGGQAGWVGIAGARTGQAWVYVWDACYLLQGAVLLERASLCNQPPGSACCRLRCPVATLALLAQEQQSKPLLQITKELVTVNNGLVTGKTEVTVLLHHQV